MPRYSSKRVVDVSSESALREFSLDSLEKESLARRNLLSWGVIAMISSVSLFFTPWSKALYDTVVARQGSIGASDEFGHLLLTLGTHHKIEMVEALAWVSLCGLALHALLPNDASNPKRRKALNAEQQKKQMVSLQKDRVSHGLGAIVLPFFMMAVMSFCFETLYSDNKAIMRHRRWFELHGALALLGTFILPVLGMVANSMWRSRRAQTVSASASDLEKMADQCGLRLDVVAYKAETLRDSMMLVEPKAILINGSWESLDPKNKAILCKKIHSAHAVAGLSLPDETTVAVKGSASAKAIMRSLEATVEFLKKSLAISKLLRRLESNGWIRAEFVDVSPGAIRSQWKFRLCNKFVGLFEKESLQKCLPGAQLSVVGGVVTVDGVSDVNWDKFDVLLNQQGQTKSSSGRSITPPSLASSVSTVESFSSVSPVSDAASSSSAGSTPRYRGRTTSGGGGRARPHAGVGFGAGGNAGAGAAGAGTAMAAYPAQVCLTTDYGRGSERVMRAHRIASMPAGRVGYIKVQLSGVLKKPSQQGLLKDFFESSDRAVWNGNVEPLRKNQQVQFADTVHGGRAKAMAKLKPRHEGTYGSRRAWLRLTDATLPDGRDVELFTAVEVPRVNSSHGKAV